MAFKSEIPLPKEFIKYSLDQKKYVAFIDIIGFSSAFQNESKSNLALNTYGYFYPCIEYLRKKIDLYSQSKPLLSIDFIQISDSLIIYSDCPSLLIDMTSFTFGSAVVWGVPLRCRLGYGSLTHIENKNRPGTIITLIGSSLIDAYKTETSVKGTGMRLLASKKFLENCQSNLKAEFRKFCSDSEIHEYRWWKKCDIDHDNFLLKIDEWWKIKSIGKWFSGKNREDTEQVFKEVIEDLESVSGKI